MDDTPDEKNGGTPPPRPAKELPLHPLYHRGDPKAPPPAQAINIIPHTETTPGDLPVVAMCPYCMADLSTVTVGRYMVTPEGKGVQAFYPLRCPECKHPLLFMAGPHKVIRAGGPLV